MENEKNLVPSPTVFLLGFSLTVVIGVFIILESSFICSIPNNLYQWWAGPPKNASNLCLKIGEEIDFGSWTSEVKIVDENLTKYNHQWIKSENITMRVDVYNKIFVGKSKKVDYQNIANTLSREETNWLVWKGYNLFLRLEENKKKAVQAEALKAFE